MGGFTNPAALVGLSPSANIGGNSNAVPSPYGSSSSAGLGGATNPFLPLFPNGQNVAGPTNPFASAGVGAPMVSAGAGTGFPANSGGVAAPGVVGPSSIVSSLNTQSGPATSTGNISVPTITQALRNSGVPKGIAGLLANFISSGAGYNPQVAAALIAQMQPGIERGTENIAEQFSAEGGRFSSAAATGIGDFMSQVQLNEGQIFAKLFEDSVQNYLTVLNGRQKKDSGGGILGGISSFLGGIGGEGIGSIAQGLSGGGGITDVLSSLAGMLIP